MLVDALATRTLDIKDSSSKFLTIVSASRVAKPVMFLPGRAKLTAYPLPTGFASATVTMGIVVVDCSAARLACVPLVRIRSTLARTSSLATPGRRVESPSAKKRIEDNVPARFVVVLAHAQQLATLIAAVD